MPRDDIDADQKQNPLTATQLQGISVKEFCNFVAKSHSNSDTGFKAQYEASITLNNYANTCSS